MTSPHETFQEREKEFDGLWPGLWTSNQLLGIGQCNRQVKSHYRSTYIAGLESVRKLILTHPEGEGKWCDTGEDMEWACRSDCMKSAITRLDEEIKLIEKV